MSSEELEARIRSLESKVKETRSLKTMVAALEKKLARLQDVEDIKKRQKAYGYYAEHMMYDEIVDCFSDSPDVVLNWLEGKFVGKEGIRKYFAFMKSTPLEFQHQVMQLTGIVDVDTDVAKAKGRWYAFGAFFIPLEENIRRSFVSGIYEIEYIKEADV